MKTKINYLALLVLLGAMLLSACGAAAPATSKEAPSAPAMEAPPLAEQSAPSAGGGANGASGGGATGADSTTKGQPADLPVGPIYNTGPVTTNGAPADASAHKIIKNADIKLQVADTDVAINRVTQAVGDAGGYIISSRVWSQANYDGVSYKYATITIGVPVTEFERILTRLRGFAVQVLDETASGEDVTKQFVDLQSQLANLEATRDRIKSFLAQAKTVDEALRINQELSNVEAQIEQIKGQMNYLQDRSAYSTITVNLEPKKSDLIATPTPTPMPDSWNPGDTFKNAQETLFAAYQVIAKFLIWFFIVIVPIVAPPIFILWLLWKWLARKLNSPK
jgi:hypothetical protein